MNKLLKLIGKMLLLILSLLISLSQYAQHISVDNGYLVNTGNLVLSGNLSLNVDGSLNSKGGSHFLFQGNALQQISGSGNMGFSDITINNSSTGVRLSRDISLYGDLTMTDGNLDILNYSLTLGQNGDIIGENTTSMIISTSGTGIYTTNADAGDGSITRTIDISTSGVSNAAGLGVSVTPTTNWGSCLITRSHQRIVGFDGDNSVFRKITITPTNSGDLASNITIKYNSDELNGHSAGNLKIYQLTTKGSKGGDEWQELPSSDNGSEVSASSIDVNETELIITLASTASTLPISLLDFTGNCDNGIIHLNWHTASEYNNDYFIIEKSYDGINYKEFAHANGNGTAQTISSYTITDIENSQAIFYRLSQVDYDGKKTIFKPIKTSCDYTREIEYTIVNPVDRQIQFWSSEALTTQVTCMLYDMTGKVVLKKNLKVNQSTWSFPVGSLSNGLYHLQLISSNQQISKTISITK